MKHAQIGSVTAGPRKYFKKPVFFSVMDINVDIVDIKKLQKAKNYTAFFW